MAGIFSNILTALIFAILYGLFLKIAVATVSSAATSSLVTVIAQIFMYIISINCMFGILNIIPLAGFDGFYIVRDLFPKVYYKYADNMIRYQMIIFLVLIIPIGSFSILGLIVGYPSNALYQLFLGLANLFI